MSILHHGEIKIASISAADADGSTLDRYRLSLSRNELTRANRLNTDELRREYIISHGLLREILGSCLDENPAAVVFSGSQHEKPKVAYPADTDIEFSLAHSSGRIACAVTFGRRVGIDIEAICPAKFDPALPATVFSDGELREWQSLPDSLKLRGFFCGWTRKEAFVKAVGRGLSLDLKSFSVTVDPRKPATLIAPPGFAHEQWNIHRLELCPYCEAALAIEGSGYELVTV